MPRSAAASHRLGTAPETGHGHLARRPPAEASQRPVIGQTADPLRLLLGDVVEAAAFRQDDSDDTVAVPSRSRPHEWYGFAKKTANDNPAATRQLGFPSPRASRAGGLHIKNEKSRRRPTLARASPALPSAMEPLTSVFGTGTGVSAPPWPPAKSRQSGAKENRNPPTGRAGKAPLLVKQI